MSNGTVDLNELMGRFTLTAALHDIELMGKWRWYWRVWLALKLFRLGAWVAGVGFELEKDGYE